MTSTPNGTSRRLPAQLAQLLDHRSDRVSPVAAEQEAGVEDDRRGAARARHAGRVIEHADRHPQLLAALGVADEGRDRRVDRERDIRLPPKRAKAAGVVPVHPEAAREVDLAGGVAVLHEPLHGILGSLAGRDERRAEADGAHPASLALRS
jgi:hypothetical protein